GFDFGYGVEIGLAFGEFHEEFLRGEGGVVLEFLRGAAVGAVGLLETGFGGVGEVGGEDLVVDAGFYRRVADGEGDFAAFEEIAGHPVSRAEVDFIVAAIGEMEDAGVLEEAADYGAHADAAREPLDAGAKDAEAAD